MMLKQLYVIYKKTGDVIVKKHFDPHYPILETTQSQLFGGALASIHSTLNDLKFGNLSVFNTDIFSINILILEDFLVLLVSLNSMPIPMEIARGFMKDIQQAFAELSKFETPTDVVESHHIVESLNNVLNKWHPHYPAVIPSPMFLLPPEKNATNTIFTIGYGNVNSDEDLFKVISHPTHKISTVIDIRHNVYKSHLKSLQVPHIHETFNKKSITYIRLSPSIPYKEREREKANSFIKVNKKTFLSYSLIQEIKRKHHRGEGVLIFSSVRNLSETYRYDFALSLAKKLGMLYVYDLLTEEEIFVPLLIYKNNKIKTEEKSETDEDVLV